MKLSFNLVALILLFALSTYGQSAPCAIGAFMVFTHHAEGDRLQILDVISNSPASRAGLVAGQIVSAIDGVPTVGLTLADCVRRIQGKAATKVLLEVEDPLQDRTNLVEVTREVVAGDLLAVTANTFEIPRSERRLSVSVSTNQVVRVLGTNGAITVIQFTHFGPTNATYHWRSRLSPGGIVASGTGVVFADYERHLDDYGRMQLRHRGSQDDLFVKAGNVRLEWSVGGPTYGWLYYYEAKEKVEVLDSSLFNSDLK